MKSASSLLGCLLVLVAMHAEAQQDSYASERRRMVEQQIEARGIHDAAILDAMTQVPRHLFVPEHVRERAYQDSPLPIGEDQTISQPYVVAVMTSLLGLTGDERVLEIGTGSGYQAAILSRLAAEVYTIEIRPALGERASEALDRLGFDNVHVRIGDGYAGWVEAAPFDAIIVTAAPESIPQPLIDQLKLGGRLVIPLGGYIQELTLMTKTEEGLEKRHVFPVRFVPMTGRIEQIEDGRRR